MKLPIAIDLRHNYIRKTERDLQSLNNMRIQCKDIDSAVIQY